MSKKTSLLIFIIGLFLGFLIPRSPEVSFVPKSIDQDDQKKVKDLTQKFQKISEEDIAEYLQLKEMKAKYEKADEIFGKILNIFLLDLGLRISGKQLEDLKAKSHAAPDSIRSPPPINIPQIEKNEPKVEATEHPRPTDIKTYNHFSDEQISKLLNEKKLADPLESWNTAKSISRQAFNLISGRFAGTISFLDSSKTSLDLEMELIGASFNQGEIKGEFLLKTTDPSNPNYRDITSYKPHSKIPNFRLAEDGAVLVEAMGGDGLFQLYYFPRAHSFRGTLYEKQGLEKFKPTGNISLSRQ